MLSHFLVRRPFNACMHACVPANWGMQGLNSSQLASSQPGRTEPSGNGGILLLACLVHICVRIPGVSLDLAWTACSAFQVALNKKHCTSFLATLHVLIIRQPVRAR